MARGRRGGRRGRRRVEAKKEFNIDMWQPRTGIGQAVKERQMTDISQILRNGIPIKETGIVDVLVPDLKEEILGVSLVQRMHKSGRRVKFKVVAVVGNQDGIVGVGHGSTRDISSSIRKAIDAAKLNIVEVARGCGSWECGCGRPHTVPFKVAGKSGSVIVTVKPAPRGLGLASAEIPRTILRMAGIKDAWTRSGGQTRTTLNFAFATMEALRQTTKTSLREGIEEKILVGKVGEPSG